MKNYTIIFLTAFFCIVTMHDARGATFGFSVVQEDRWMSSEMGDDTLNYHLSEFNSLTDTLVSAVFTFDIVDDIPSIGEELEDEGGTLYMFFGSFFDIIGSFYITKPSQHYSIDLIQFLLGGYNGSSDLVEIMVDTSGYHQDNGGNPDIFPDFTIKNATLSYAVERPAPVPEPSPILLLAMGLTGVLGKKIRWKTDRVL